MRKTKIKSQEEKIFDLLDEGNALAVGAFEKLYTRFEEDDAMHYTLFGASMFSGALRSIITSANERFTAIGNRM